MTRRSALLSVLASMLIFGTIGIFRRGIDLPSGVIAMGRGAVGFVFLLLYLLLRRKKMDLHSIRKNLLPLAVTGAFLGFNWILLFEAYRYTTVAAATLCYYLAPVIIVLVSPFLLREKLRLRQGICAAVAFLGMIPVSGILEGGFSGASDGKGLLLGFAAAVLYASIVLINKRIIGVSTIDRTIVQLGVSSLVLLPYCIFTGELASCVWTPGSVALLVTVGLIHTGLAYALYFSALPVLPARTAALMSYTDPVTAVLLSAFLLGEPLSPLGYVGALMILGSAVVSELPEKKKETAI